MANPLASLRPETDDYSMAQPEPELDISDEVRKKSISRTKRWKEFKAMADQRRAMYQKQTPGGVFYNQMPKADAAFYSAVGNAVIDEMDYWIAFIEQGDL